MEALESSVAAAQLSAASHSHSQSRALPATALAPPAPSGPVGDEEAQGMIAALKKELDVMAQRLEGLEESQERSAAAAAAAAATTAPAAKAVEEDLQEVMRSESPFC
jgi:hypothetical protein